MKKALLVLFMVLFASAAWAEVKFDLSGTFHARGNYWKNFNQTTPAATYDGNSYSDYDGDINLYPKIIVDNTTLNFAVAIRDETWAGNNTNSNGTFNTNPDTNDVYQDYTGSKDDNISIERAWLNHKFTSTGTTIDVGLMDGQGWATSFADYIMGRYRVKVTQKTPFGVVGALLEKDAELGNSDVEDSEKDDYDSFVMFAVTKAGSVYIKPLLFYVYNSGYYKSVGVPATLPVVGAVTIPAALNTIDNSNDNKMTVLYLALGFDGTLGPIEFESELGYKKYESKATINAVGDYNIDVDGDGFAETTAVADGTQLAAYDEDWVEWGAYVNFWKTLDAMKPGFLFAYGSWDKNGGPTGAGKGFDFRDDFCSNLILGDWVAWGDNTGADEDLVGMTVIKPYVADIKTPVKDLTASASFGYVMSNQEDNAYEDATAWEVDLGAAYKISANLTYSVDLGYADINYDVDGIADPDPIMLLSHKLKLSF